jgi:hypothetical protein
MVYFIEPTSDESGVHLYIRMNILTSDKIMANCPSASHGGTRRSGGTASLDLNFGAR